jgi:hypothetical protein
MKVLMVMIIDARIVMGRAENKLRYITILAVIVTIAGKAFH